MRTLRIDRQVIERCATCDAMDRRRGAAMRALKRFPRPASCLGIPVAHHPHEVADSCVGHLDKSTQWTDTY